MCPAEAVPVAVPAPVSKKQAFALAKPYNLGLGGGFSAFVPEWDRVMPGIDPVDKAIALLTEAGANMESASEAISFLIKSRPESDSGKAFRQHKAWALLFRQEVPVERPVSPIAHLPRPPMSQRPVQQPVQTGKPDVAALSKAELDLAMAKVRLHELRVKLAGGDPNKT